MAISRIKILISLINCLFVCSNGCFVSHQSSKTSNHPDLSIAKHPEISDDSVGNKMDYIINLDIDINISKEVSLSLG